MKLIHRGLASRVEVGHRQTCLLHKAAIQWSRVCDSVEAQIRRFHSYALRLRHGGGASVRMHAFMRKDLHKYPALAGASKALASSSPRARPTIVEGPSSPAKKPFLAAYGARDLPQSSRHERGVWRGGSLYQHRDDCSSIVFGLLLNQALSAF